MRSSLPLVSVITCVKNNQAFLSQCLDSIAAQNYPYIEHIIVDGHSTDNSMSIIKKYISSHPHKNIRLFVRPPKGIANALNYGISQTHGKYIHIVHADDYYFSPSSIKKAVDIFLNNPDIHWIVGNHLLDIDGKVITLKNRLLAKKFGKYLIWVIPWMSHQNMFYDRDIYLHDGLYDETYRNSLDYEQWLRLIKKNPIKVVNEKFSVFRVHLHSTTFNPLNLPRLLSENIRAVLTNL